MDSNYNWAIFSIIFAVLALVVVGYLNMRRRSPFRPKLASVFDSIFYYPQKWRILLWSQGCDIHTCIKNAMQVSGLNDFGDNDNGSFIKRYEVARNVGLKASKAEVLLKQAQY